MLTWHITHGGSEGTLFELGWRTGLIRFRPCDRDTAEQAGDLKHGDWLMDGKWLAFHRSRDKGADGRLLGASLGIAFGERYWLWDWERPHSPDPRSWAEKGKEVRQRVGDFIHRHDAAKAAE